MESKIPLGRIGEIMEAVLSELKNAGGKARLKDLFARVEPKLKLSEYEKQFYAKSGYIRWRAIVHLCSIDCAKSGYIRKQSGIWSLTPLGEAALKKGPEAFIRSTAEQYRAWNSIGATDDSGEDSEVLVRQTAYEQAVEQARIHIEDHINQLSEYDFQKLVAELLVAMGYHLPFATPPGREGGIDMVAYRDPLGAEPPRFLVQVNHRAHKTTSKEVQELDGILRKEGDIGLIVSSSSFTLEVEREIRASTKHIESMDLDRLIRLWEQHYDKVRASGKALLPLVRLYILAPEEE